jgi:hypothetical protein
VGLDAVPGALAALWTVGAVVVVEALDVADELAGEAVVEVVVEAGEAVVEALAAGAVALDACADFSSSCLAFCWELATAPWALAIARVSPSTPGAEPW